jgi:hypothetical protein
LLPVAQDPGVRAAASGFGVAGSRGSIVAASNFNQDIDLAAFFVSAAILNKSYPNAVGCCQKDIFFSGAAR